MPTIDNPSIQLYTVREALQSDVVGTLGSLAQMGYRQVEPFSFVSYAADLKTGLAEHGLSAPTTHMSLLAADDELLHQTFEAAKDLGIGTVIDPHSDAEKWKRADDIAQIAAGLNSAAAKAAEHGLRVGYHNHWFELDQDVDGRHGLEVLADHLDPAVVLEVDTYWAHVGGADVPALLRRLGERVVALHIKDGDGTRNNKNQVAVGSGSIPVWDFVAAAPWVEVSVVELDDTTGDVFEAVRQSYAYVTGREA